MNNTIKFYVNSENSGKRLDIFLAKKINNLTRSYLKLIENKEVKLNGAISLSPSTKIKNKDEILINIVEKQNHELIPKKIDLDIIYEDKDILVLNKPKGMVVHPGAETTKYIGKCIDI